MEWCSALDQAHNHHTPEGRCFKHGGGSAHLSRLVREGLVSEETVNAGRIYGRSLHPAPKDVNARSIRPLTVTEDKDGLHYHAVAHNGLLVELTNRDAVHHADGTSVDDNYYMVRVSRPGDTSWGPRAIYTDILMHDVRINHLGLLSDLCEILGAEDASDQQRVHRCLGSFNGLAPDDYLMTMPASVDASAQQSRLSPVPGRSISVDDSHGSSLVWLLDPAEEHVIEVAESDSILSAYADALASYMGLRRLPHFIEEQSVLVDTTHHKP